MKKSQLKEFKILTKDVTHREENNVRRIHLLRNEKILFFVIEHCIANLELFLPRVRVLSSVFHL